MAVTSPPRRGGHPGMVGGVTLQAQAVPHLQEKAEGRRSWVSWSREALCPLSLPPDCGPRCPGTLTETVSSRG